MSNSIEPHPDHYNEKNQERIEPLDKDVHCPKVKIKGQETNNWSSVLCITRIEEGSRCIKTCVVAQKILAEKSG